jgi:O-antigen/teichoic acid export membrane protein
VVPWQFAIRAVMVVTGLTMLLFAHVHGALFYVAWGLIALALVSEGAATFFYRRRARRHSGS